MTQENTVVDVKNLTLEYKAYKYRATTLKEFVMNRLRGKGSYQKITALKDINFDIKRGESVALIGHNGCGKSTLLKCLAGIYQPEGAQIRVSGRIAPMIELGAGFDGELSGMENIRLSCMLMGLSADEIEEKVESIVDFSELRNFIDIPFKNYSSGMQARLGFACTTAVDPDVLLIDEVLAVGDSNFSRKCFERIQFLKERGTTVVLVSHDLGAVRTFCERGIVIDEGVMQFDGGVIEAIRCQEAIMERRYLESLSANERREVLRLKALQENALQPRESQAPMVDVFFQALQGGNSTLNIDARHSFDFLFKVRARKAEFFDGEIAVGFGLNNLAGTRVGGFNNVKQSVSIPSGAFADERFVEVKFPFPDGLGCLSPGSYKIFCGVHDRGIRRSLYHQEVAVLTVVNGADATNVDGDIVAFEGIIGRIVVGRATTHV